MPFWKSIISISSSTLNQNKIDCMYKLLEPYKSICLFYICISSNTCNIDDSFSLNNHKKNINIFRKLDSLKIKQFKAQKENTNPVKCLKLIFFLTIN